MLTELEKVAVRGALGFPNMTTGVTLSMGVPAAGHQMFMLEMAMDRVLPQSETRIREVLAEIRCIELQMSHLKSRLSTDQVGDIRFRSRGEIEDLTDLLRFWTDTLSDIFALGPNVFSFRHRRMGGEWTSS